MAKRETTKVVELQGRQWQLSRMDPLTCNYLATKLIGRVGPVIMAVLSGGVDNKAALVMGVSDALAGMSRAELTEIQLEALSTVGEMVTQPNGMVVAMPLRLASGAWGVDDVGDNPPLVMALVCQAVLWNLSPFFDASALESLLGSFLDTIPQGASTSTSSAMPQ